jgi:hypothetical protein
MNSTAHLDIVFRGEDLQFWTNKPESKSFAWRISHKE